jgi:hypothetical protein
MEYVKPLNVTNGSTAASYVMQQQKNCKSSCCVGDQQEYAISNHLQSLKANQTCCGM